MKTPLDLVDPLRRVFLSLLKEIQMTKITPRMAAELLSHEGLVREAYKDSVGVWTWSVGITDASGHKVGRYKDNPQSIERCLEVYIWVLETNYLPAVLDAFKDMELTEEELTAALSFHYNTGAIGRATWVQNWLDDDIQAAHKNMLNWAKPKELLGRRIKERSLFFDGKWSGDGKVLVYNVAKPSYLPVNGKRVNVMSYLENLL